MLAFDAVVDIIGSDRALVEVNGDLDVVTAPLLLGAARKVLDHPITSLVLDLRGVNSVDPAGVEALTELESAIVALGGRLELTGATLVLEHRLRQDGLAELFV